MPEDPDEQPFEVRFRTIDGTTWVDAHSLALLLAYHQVILRQLAITNKSEKTIAGAEAARALDWVIGLLEWVQKTPDDADTADTKVEHA